VFGSVRARLLGLALLGVLPLICLLAWNGWQARELAVAAAKEDLSRRVRLLVGDITGDVRGTHQLLQALGAHPEVGAARQPACGEVLRAQLALGKHYTGFVVAERTGQSSCDSLGSPKPANYADREYFARALLERAPVVGRPAIGRLSGRPSLPVAVPLLDASGEVERVIATGLDLGSFSGWRGLAGAAAGTAFAVWDANGTILYRHPDNAQWAGKRFADLDLWRSMRSATGATVLEAGGVDGVRRVYAVGFLDDFPDAGLYFSLGVPRPELTAGPDQVFLRSVIVLALVAAAVLALGWFLAERHLRRPVALLDAAGRRLGAGDFTVRVDDSVARGGELGRLIRGFNEAAAALEMKHAESRELMAELEHAAAMARAERDVLELIGADRPLTEVFDAITRNVEAGSPGALSSILLLGSDGIHVQHGAAPSLPVDFMRAIDGAPIGASAGSCGTAMYRNEQVIVTDIATDPLWANYAPLALQHGLRACWSTPVRSGTGKVLGSFAIYYRKPLGPGKADLELIERWTRLTGVAIERARALEQIRVLNKDLESRVAERTAELARANAALARASEMKSQFLATMSHELRTPLNAIIGFSEVLNDGLAGDLTGEQRGFVGDIHASGRHLLSLINDILDLSKVEAGMMTLEPEPVDLAPLLQGGLTIVKERALKQRVSLALEIEPGLPRFAADTRKVKQIVFNLLANAVKFTPEGGRVRVAARRVAREEVALPAGRAGRMGAPPESEAREFVEIAVADSGIGIAGEDLERLFQPFVQVDSALARRHEGTGLGLALVMRLAGLHGGTAGVASAPGEGSTFYVWLPLADAPGPGKAAPAAPRAARPARAEPLALVVEDDDAAARMIERALRAEGFRCRRASTGEEALVRAAKEPPDLITLDVFLAHMDGWEFLERLKAVPDLADIPVVIVSVAPNLEHGVALGATRVLQKPCTQEALRAALAGIVATGGAALCTVLVVDDNPQAVELLAGQLEGCECRLLRAFGGREALEAVRRERPDLILLDLLMPDLSGFEVIERLKADPATAAIPVIVVTAKDLSAEERAALNGSVRRIVAKSALEPRDFVAEVRRALRRPGPQG
jgi:signal transduction histidine kinase/DNA-binding response OmpR family regulator